MTTPAPAPAPTAPRWQIVVALVLIYVIWGSTYLAIGIAVETMPPLLMAGARFLIAGILLYGVMRWRGEPVPSLDQWRGALIVGSLLLLGGNGLVCLAERSVVSSLAALVVATVPLWMVLLPWMTGGSRPPTRTLVALATGLVGVGVLTVGGLDHGIDPTGAALLLAAALSWAIGSLYSRRLRHPQSPLMSTSLQMIGGGGVLLVTAWCAGDLPRTHLQAMTTASVLSFAYLVTLGSIVGFGSYVFLLRHTSTMLATSYSYVNPLVALALGCLLHHEPLGPTTPIAAVLIVGAVVVMSRPTTAATTNDPGTSRQPPILATGKPQP